MHILILGEKSEDSSENDSNEDDSSGDSKFVLNVSTVSIRTTRHDRFIIKINTRETRLKKTILNCLNN